MSNEIAAHPKSEQYMSAMNEQLSHAISAKVLNEISFFPQTKASEANAPRISGKVEAASEVANGGKVGHGDYAKDSHSSAKDAQGAESSFKQFKTNENTLSGSKASSELQNHKAPDGSATNELSKHLQDPTDRNIKDSASSILSQKEQHLLQPMDNGKLLQGPMSDSNSKMQGDGHAWLNIPDLPIQSSEQNKPKEDITGLGQQEGGPFSKTIHDKVRDHVVSTLPPSDRKSYDAEDKAMADWQAQHQRNQELLKSGAMIMIHEAPPPAMPMHDQVDKQAKDNEQKILDQARKGMSPEDQMKLSRDFADYQYRMTNPDAGRMFGTEPSARIQEYWKRVREASKVYEDQ